MSDATGSAPGREAHEGGLAHVRVVRGAPDDIELAALVAGIAAVSSPDHDGDGDGAASLETSRWADHATRLPGAARSTGPDAWRWSLR